MIRRHPIMDRFLSLAEAHDGDLEQAVDDLLAESAMSWGDYDGQIAMRAEALAVLSHEFRRRSDKQKEALEPMTPKESSE